MCRKREINLGISPKKYQKQSKETPRANKAFFDVTSEKTKKIILKADKVFNKIWHNNN